MESEAGDRMSGNARETGKPGRAEGGTVPNTPRRARVEPDRRTGKTSTRKEGEAVEPRIPGEDVQRRREHASNRRPPRRREPRRKDEHETTSTRMPHRRRAVQNPVKQSARLLDPVRDARKREAGADRRRAERRGTRPAKPTTRGRGAAQRRGRRQEPTTGDLAKHRKQKRHGAPDTPAATSPDTPEHRRGKQQAPGAGLQRPAGNRPSPPGTATTAEAGVKPGRGPEASTSGRG